MEKMNMEYVKEGVAFGDLNNKTPLLKISSVCDFIEDNGDLGDNDNEIFINLNRYVYKFIRENGDIKIKEFMKGNFMVK